jgi:hypothetical protein
MEPPKKRGAYLSCVPAGELQPSMFCQIDRVWANGNRSQLVGGDLRANIRPNPTYVCMGADWTSPEKVDTKNVLMK